MFQFPGFASTPYGFRCRYRICGGFPHSEIHGSKGARPSPRLIAACHVLHRLSVPRHPPDALKTLDLSRYGPPGATHRGKPPNDDTQASATHFTFHGPSPRRSAPKPCDATGEALPQPPGPLGNRPISARQRQTSNQDDPSLTSSPCQRSAPRHRAGTTRPPRYEIAGGRVRVVLLVR